jgi:flagellar biosynthetic protein FliR
VTFAIPLAPLVLTLLGALRAGVVLVMLPVAGGAGVPSPLRVLLSFALAVVLVGVPAGAMPATAADLALCAGRELLFGLVLGFLCQSLLAAPALAGDLVAQELGLKMSEDVDPMTRLPMTAVSRIYETALLLVFLCVAGHHDVLRALHASFERFPVGDLALPAGLSSLAGTAGACLRFAVQIAAPLFAVLLCGSLVLALLTRAVPELHVMTFGYPMRLLAAMVAAVALFPTVLQPGARLIATLQRALLVMAGA